MPIPLLPLAIAGIGAASSGINSWLQNRRSRQNTNKTIRANKELAQYQYAQEMEQLKYMNEYNAPANQRARLEDANLNPALMYKSAPSNVQTEMPKYNRPDVDYNVSPVQIPNPLESMADYYDVRIKNQQVDNMKSQQENTDMDTALKAADKAKRLTETAKTQFDLDLASELKKYTLEYAKQRNENQYRDWLIQEKTWQGKEIDNSLKRIDLELRKMGIYPGDPMYMRMFMLKMKKTGKRHPSGNPYLDAFINNKK